tara:strand:+ start:445 stop:642 length:198 start_codon:yes stop_codon:yes gene_type:complete
MTQDFNIPEAMEQENYTPIEMAAFNCANVVTALVVAAQLEQAVDPAASAMFLTMASMLPAEAGEA